VTIERLRELAELAMKLLKRGAETGQPKPVWAVHHSDTGELTQLPFPEGAQGLLNIGRAKDVLFGFVRAMVKRDPTIDAVIFGTDVWVAKETELGRQHREEARKREYHGQGFPKLVELGWVTRTEAFLVTAQTPDTVIMLQIEYIRNPEFASVILGEQTEQIVRQSEFRGRQKMWGDLQPENIR
jgi:hypothetical protein